MILHHVHVDVSQTRRFLVEIDDTFWNDLLDNELSKYINILYTIHFSAPLEIMSEYDFWSQLQPLVELSHTYQLCGGSKISHCFNIITCS